MCFRMQVVVVVTVEEEALLVTELQVMELQLTK